MAVVADIHLIVSGSIDRVSGGSRFNKHLFEELAKLTGATYLHEVSADFPHPSRRALDELDRRLQTCDRGSVVLIDGLVFTVAADVLRHYDRRLTIVALANSILSTFFPDEHDHFAAEERRAYGLCHRVVTPSAATRAELVARLGIEPERVACVAPALPPTTAEGRSYKALPHDLLMVANVLGYKGYPYLVEELGNLADLPWRLRVCGDTAAEPGLFARLQPRLAALGLDGRVDFLGPVTGDDLAREYRAADLFLLPSLHETWAMVLDEALAYRLPVVCSDLDVLQRAPAESSVRFASGVPGALGGVLRELLQDPARYGGLCAGCAKSELAARSWGDVARELVDRL